MPWGTIIDPATSPEGWQPPANMGKVISPRIFPATANWTGPTAEAIYPSFCTALGQQLLSADGRGYLFCFWGTYGKNAFGGTGYLRNPYDQENTYGLPPNLDWISYDQVEAANDWQQSSGNSFTPIAPPAAVAPPPSAARLIAQQAIAILQTIP